MTFNNEKTEAVKQAELEILKQCETLGHGHVIEIATKAWLEHNKEANDDLMIKPCNCNSDSNCEWCAGTGWLTKKVSQLKFSTEKATKAKALLNDMFDQAL